MAEGFDGERFVAAQAPVMAQVLRELGEGRKGSHWMWFVFPQLSGLGHSAMSRRYALASIDEARAYLAHAVLRPRLVECTRLVNAVEGRTICEVLGSPDDAKFRSCMTLFALAGPEEAVFAEALAKWFGGVGDAVTEGRLGGGG